MFKSLIKGLLAGIAIKLLNNYRRLSLQLLRIEVAKCYLRGVQLARMSMLGLMSLGLVIGLIGIGALLFHAGLFILLPWTLEAKAVLGMILGLVYMVGGGLTLRAVMGEKLWMTKSGAVEMLKEAIELTSGDDPDRRE